MPLTGTQIRLIRMSTWVVYGTAAALATIGTYNGWLFKSHTKGTDPAAIVFVTLLGATLLAQKAGAFPEVAAWKALLKAIGYCALALLWVGFAMRRVPDTAAGVTLVMGPTYALLLAGMFYFTRFAARRAPWWSSTLTRSLQSSKPLPPSTPGSAPMVDLTASGRELSGRVEIAPNRMAVLLRTLGFMAFAALIGPVLYLIEKGTLSPVAFGIVFGTPATLGLLWSLWTLTANGPAMTLGQTGLSVQRGLCAIRRLAWPEIKGFELRKSGLNAFLVVHVRDAESLIAHQSVVGQWLMRQSQKTFGSPIRIPTGWLKCDRDWLLQTANDMLAAHDQQIESVVKIGPT